MKSPPLLLKLILLSILAGPVSLSALTVLWVAPDGRDDSPGTSDQPFATLTRARDAVRTLRAGGFGSDVEVRLRGGEYRFAETLVLTPGDGGTALHTVTFAAAEGERPVIKGSRLLTGTWQRVDGDLWKLFVPAAANRQWVFRSLFRNGDSLRRGREPDTGFFTLKSVDSTRRIVSINEALPENWSTPEGTELNSTAYWHFNRQPIESFSPDEKQITTRIHVGTNASSFLFGNKGHERIWVENALVFVDEPGEWYLDDRSGELFLRTNAGENPNDSVFSAPVLSELVVVRGDPNNLVRQVRFRGIEFAETDWVMPTEGRLGIQAGAWGVDRSRTYTPPAAIRFIYAWDTAVVGCQFRDLGEGAIAFEIGTRNGRVERCDFTRIGANVIQVGRMPEYTGDRHPLHRDFSSWGDWADSLQAYPASQAIWLHTSQTIPEAPSQIDLVENTIVDSCHIDLGSVGIWVGYANYVRIQRNHLRGLPYTGISVGWRWGPGLTNCHSNLIAGNLVEEVMRQVGDGAGIYLVGEQPGTRVIENYVRDSGGNYWAHGIYTDESSDHMEVAGNYVNDTADFSIFMNRNGLNQVLRDNNGEKGPTLLTERDQQGRLKAEFEPERKPPLSESGEYRPRVRTP
jgi:hypothetical protein